MLFIEVKMNEKALKTLEFDKIIEKVASFASSYVGKDMVRTLKPSNNIEEIKIWQKETS